MQEMDRFLEALYEHSGYDFRDYARSSLTRRLRHVLADEALPGLPALQDRVLHDPACLDRLLLTASVNVTAMFRDAGFYRALRTHAVPWLRTYPFVRVWIAGCSTGEEAYSVAIVLEEEGLYDRTRIYVTDISESAVRKSAEGVFPIRVMQAYTRNYQTAGGLGDFSAWYTANYDNAIVRSELKRNMVFAAHNLASDGVFNEFHLILCRNVMIYFNATLQARVHELLYQSLAPFGLLGLGAKEALHFSPRERSYETLDAEHKLYKKIT